MKNKRKIILIVITIFMSVLSTPVVFATEIDRATANANFLQTIPYRFYNILILVFVFLTSLLLKDFGPMYKAEIEARRRGLNDSENEVALFQSALVASIVAMVMGVSKKVFTVSEAIDTWIDGMKPLLITGVILLLAWSLSSVIKDLGTAKYLVTLLSGSLPNFLLPSLIFILGAIISFATGTAYGTMGILMLLAIPLAYSMNADMSYVIVSTSAVLTGAIFGKKVEE